MVSVADFNILPQDCVSKILSLTTPQDVCRSSMVSSIFRSAADSEIVWETFLPSNYDEIVAKSITPLMFSSKKELFFCLCDSILVDGGNKSFALERSSGKVSYKLSARDLSITWSNFPMYWCWKSILESRFSEAVELITTSWLEIHGKINTKKLSPNTTYGAYLMIKFSNRAYGLDTMPSQISIQVGDNQVFNGTSHLCVRHNEKQRMCAQTLKGDHARVASVRDDGWMEIELGEFSSGESDEDVKMSLMEVRGVHLKGGIVIEGIEVRPKK